MSIHKLVGMFLLFCLAGSTGAQSIWDSGHLAQVKANL